MLTILAAVMNWLVSTPGISLPMCRWTWHCVWTLGALYAMAHWSPNIDFAFVIAALHRSMRCSLFNRSTDRSCVRGRASQRLGLLGLVSLRKKTLRSVGCF